VISPLQSSEEGVDKTLARVRSAAIMKALEKEETCRRLEDLDIALGSTSTLPDISAAFGLTSQHIEVAVVRKFK
jgi:hypothetical protein